MVYYTEAGLQYWCPGVHAVYLIGTSTSGWSLNGSTAVEYNQLWSTYQIRVWDSLWRPTDVMHLHPSASLSVNTYTNLINSYEI
jgi:hypothetical protein